MDVLGKIMKLIWLNDRKLNFYYQVYNYFVIRNVFPEPVKIAVLSVNVSEEFLFGTSKPIFSGMRRLPFLSEASKEVVIFCIILFCAYCIFMGFYL